MKSDERLIAKDKNKRGLSLLQEANDYAKELKADDPSLKEKIKAFKKVYKQLNEMTKSHLRQWVEAIVVAGLLVFVLRTFVFGLYHVPTGCLEPTILVGDRLWGNKFTYYFNDIKRGDIIICDAPTFTYDKSSSINYFWQKYVGIPIPLLGLSGGPDNWTKRIIAIPGDTIEGQVEDGKTVIYLNGKKLDESSYVNPYPLIKLKKTSGFIDIDSFGPFNVPDFLRKTTKYWYYIYDPEKSFEQQPFYNMKKEDVVKNFDGRPMLRYPYTPTYGQSEGGIIRDVFGRAYQEESIDNFGPIKIPAGKYWAMGDNRKNSADSRYWGLLDGNLIHGKVSFVIYSIDSEEPLWLFELIKHPIEFWTKSVRWNRFFKNVK